MIMIPFHKKKAVLILFYHFYILYNKGKIKIYHKSIKSDSLPFPIKLY